MKDFETIEIALADGVLYIGTETSSGVKSFVSTKEDILRCISNYFEIYVFEKTKEQEKITYLSTGKVE